MAENMQIIVNEYVQKCKVAIEVKDNNQARMVWNEVCAIFINIIPGYKNSLRGYIDKETCEFNEISYDDACCLKELPIVIGKLRTYAATIAHEENIARCSQPLTTMSQTTTVDINATFSQATTFVLDSEAFSPEETSEILVKIKTLKSLANSNEDKLSKWSKVKPILEWTIARGVEIAPVIIPLITAALK